MWGHQTARNMRRLALGVTGHASERLSNLFERLSEGARSSKLAMQFEDSLNDYVDELSKMCMLIKRDPSAQQIFSTVLNFSANGGNGKGQDSHEHFSNHELIYNEFIYNSSLNDLTLFLKTRSSLNDADAIQKFVLTEITNNSSDYADEREIQLLILEQVEEEAKMSIYRDETVPGPLDPLLPEGLSPYSAEVLRIVDEKMRRLGGRPQSRAPAATLEAV